MRVSKIISLMVTTALLTACSADNNVDENKSLSSTSPVNSANNTQNATTVNAHQGVTHHTESTITAATIGNRAITLEDIDAHIQLGLFDLEWQKYQLRKSALNSFLFEQIDASTLADETAVIALKPPTPPRLGLPKDERPIMGTSNASIMMDIFCSYQSSHCARLYPILNDLENKYSGLIGFRFFDYPQRFHRYGLAAANAFRCAVDVTPNTKKIWSFQSALFADIDQLNHQRYMTLAEQLHINTPEFEACLTENRHQRAIEKDLAFGKQIGLGNVPVVFINGLYVKGANPAEMYSFYIDEELNKKGISQLILASELPITLLATTVSNIEEHSIAEFALHENDQVVRVKMGELIFSNTRIVAIQADQVLIDNNGITEFIKIRTSQGHVLADALYENASATQNISNASLEQPDEDEELDDESQHRTLPATGEMILSREWVDNQLLDQTTLEKHFYNADHIVEGNHLIKLDNIDNQRFYTTLGLKTGDVVMRINEEWVHETHNPLWASLQQNEAMTLTVIRKGLPYRYDYRIE